MSDPDPTPAENAEPDGEPAFDEATIANLEALEDILDELRERHQPIPQWEFCEGFLTAMLCARREPDQDEWLPALLGGDPDDPQGVSPFSSVGQRARFLMNWLARESQIRAALEAQVDDLSDPRALQAAVSDWRGMLNALSLEEQSDREQPQERQAVEEQAGDAATGTPPPAYARLWAVGFLAAVEIWEDDWAPPRDKEIAANMADALDCIAALAEDDSAPPAFNLFDEKAPASVSEQRMTGFGEALWAVYDLYAIAQALGPRVQPRRRQAKVGRNDPCPCGSGKKYKKCCGA